MSRFVGTGREAKRAWLYARGFVADARGARGSGPGVVCCYCDRRVYVRCSLAWTGAGLAATLDHVVPGGGHGHNNLVVACHECNNRKQDRTPAEWALSDGPADAARRALRQLCSRPTPAALEYTRGLYGLSCVGGAGSGAEPQGSVRAWTTPSATWATRGPRRLPALRRAA